MKWLLEETALNSMRAAFSAGAFPTVEQQIEYEARGRSEDSILTVVSDKAEVSVVGILTQKPDFFAKYYGGGNTTYPDIITALADAENDPAVKEITLAIDSPGGQFSGLFDALAALQAVNKPMRAVVHGQASSAAYAIASQAGEIVAMNRASQVGSVGVVATFHTQENEVVITSTDAPNKRPDVKTKAGKAAVREHLDALHEIFVDAIAVGRSITVQTVNTDFGRGSTLLAEEALSRGMIDAIQGGGKKTVAEGGNVKLEDKKMTIENLKAEHPDLFAEAVQIGATKERDRVTAHLTMGEASGAMKTAVAAIRDGSEMTATIGAEYMAAGLNRQDVSDRQEDDTEAAAGDGATAPAAGDADTVAKRVADKLGLEVQ